MRGSFSDDEQIMKVPGFDMSVAMDEAPIAKARTVTNLLYEVDHKRYHQTTMNQLNEMGFNEDRASFNLPLGALESSAISIAEDHN